MVVLIARKTKNHYEHKGRGVSSPPDTRKEITKNKKEAEDEKVFEKIFNNNNLSINCNDCNSS